MGVDFMGVEFMGVDFMGVNLLEKNYRNSGTAWPSRAGRKTTEIPDRLDPPSRHKNVKKSRFACWVVGWLVGWLVGCCCLHLAQRPPEGANILVVY